MSRWKEIDLARKKERKKDKRIDRKKYANSISQKTDRAETTLQTLA
jgi:hypothetical protein